LPFAGHGVPYRLSADHGICARSRGLSDARAATTVVHGVEHLTARAGVGMLEPHLRGLEQVQAEQLAEPLLDDEHRVAAMRTRRRPPVISRRHAPTLVACAEEETDSLERLHAAPVPGAARGSRTIVLAVIGTPLPGCGRQRPGSASSRAPSRSCSATCASRIPC
jgi:hypothetical protein